MLLSVAVIFGGGACVSKIVEPTVQYSLQEVKYAVDDELDDSFEDGVFGEPLEITQKEWDEVWLNAQRDFEETDRVDAWWKKRWEDFNRRYLLDR